MKNAQNFEQYLAKLDTANGSVRHVGWYFRLLQRVFANANQAQGYFLLAWQHLRQEREFKLRVYPNFAYFVIVIGMMIFNLARDGSDPWHSIAPYLPYAGLLLVMTMPLALWNLNYSSQPEAMKVFAYVPFADHGALAKATVDALIARMMLPVLLIFGVLGVAGVGVRGLVSFLAVLSVAYAAAMVLGRGMLGKTLPFAAPFDPNRNASSGRIMGPALASMVVSGVLIFIGAHLNSLWFDLGMLVIAAPIAYWARRQFSHIMIDLRQGA